MSEPLNEVEVRASAMIRFATSTVWATDQATRSVIASVLARRVMGVRLDRSEIEALTRDGREKPRPARGAVAVVPLWGVLVPHAGMMVDVSTEGTGLDAWGAMFDEAVADPDVATVVIHVNSPGGSTAGVTETAKKVRDARSQKRIVAVADGLAASAAYMIATQAETLIVTPSGQVGAVHCYAVHEDISAMLEREGVKLTLIAEPDEGSAEITDFLPLSDENRAHMQDVVRQFYETGVRDIAKGRGVSPSTVEASFGRGRVLTARDALATGMVDEIASFEDALARIVAGRQLTGARQTALAPAVVGSLGAGIAAASSVFIGGSTLTFDFDRPPAVSPTAAPEAAPTAATDAPTGAPTTTGGAMDTVSTDGRPPTLEELAAQKEEIRARMQEIHDGAPGRALTDAEQAAFDELDKQEKHIDKATASINARLDRLGKHTTTKQESVVDATPRFNTNADTKRRIPENIFDLTAYRGFASSADEYPALWREAAKRANETLVYETDQPDKVKVHVERLIAKSNSAHPSENAAHWILAAGSPLYDRAFGKMLMGLPLTSQEDMAIRAAVSNAGLGAETPVPVTIDPTVLLTSDGQTNPLRAIADVRTITGNTWRGISSDGVTVAYVAELTEVTPQDPDFDAPSATVVRAQGSVQFSFEVDDDWGELRSNLSMMFADAKDAKEAEKFLFGTGTNEPEGLIYALNADGGSTIETGTGHALDVSDLSLLIKALPPRFRANAQWLGTLGVYMDLADSVDDQTNFWVPISQGFANRPSGNTGHALRGYAANDASGMSDLITTTGEHVLVFGDFKKGFAIIDRLGMTIKVDPFVRNAAGKLTGAYELVCYFRNTSLLKTAAAFRMLDIKSTA